MSNMLVGSSSNNKSETYFENKALARAKRIRHPPEKCLVAFFCISGLKPKPSIYLWSYPLAINVLISFSLVNKRCRTKSHCSTDSKAGVSSPTTSCSTLVSNLNFTGNSTNQCSIRPCSILYCTVICRSVHFSAGARVDVSYYHKSNYTSKKFKITRIESLATLTAEIIGGSDEISIQRKIVLVVICFCVILRSTTCQTHGANNFYRGYPEVQQHPSAGKLYGTDNVKNHGGGGYYPLSDVNDNDSKKWQTLESSVHHHGDGSNAAAATPIDITAVTVKSGSPVVVSGGSVVIRPSAGGFVVDGGGGIETLSEPEAAGVQLQQPLSVGSYDIANDGVLQYGSPPPQHYQPFGYPFFHASGLLQRLLFGKTIYSPSPLDGYFPLCS
ncbi:hypothetical protein AGLY_013086 [Aphis glycines]|uniref:Uncharacterized protein n=1 Tax=Aphis glycines TaxID=307491 RepID=A0A6G0T9V9_APHGL|nr:hypothetical protein AGLY_013086 [Aphis glycines]